MIFKSILSFFSLAFLLLSVSANSHADQTITYTYTDLGLIEIIDGSRTDVADITTFGYDTEGNRTSITNALGHITQISAHDLSGRPLTIVDANGAETQLTYDVRGRLISQSTEGSTTTFSYDATSNVTQISQSNGQVMTYHYDSAHRPIGYSDTHGNTVSYELDNAGNKIKQNITDPADILTQTHRYLYDELSRLRNDIGSENQTASLDYNSNNNLTDQSDPNGNPTSHAFDGLNRLINTTDANNGQTTYNYDAQNNLTSVTDANGNTTTYHYDVFDNLIEQNSPDTGISTFTYDNTNNRTSQTNGQGITSKYQYDALNRLTHINYPDSSLNVTFNYDENDNNQHGIGRLTSQTDNNGHGGTPSNTNYRYDIRGNIINITTEHNALTYSIDYQYTISDQLSQITYPDGRTVAYSYDMIGNISHVNSSNDQSITQTVLYNMHYQPFGPITSQQFGNGLTSQQSIDLDYRQVSLNTPTILERDYNYDANSNIISITDVLKTENNQDFSYDSLNRLNDADGTHYGNINYQYDLVHNRTSKTSLIITLTLNDNYDYALDSNQLITKTAHTVDNYHYDKNGNIIDNGHYQFSYSQNNRLHEVRQNGHIKASYKYNAQGQRSHKIVGTSTTYYLYNPSGQLLTEIHEGKDNSLLEQLLQQQSQLKHDIAGTQTQLKDKELALQQQFDLIQITEQQLEAAKTELSNLTINEHRVIRLLTRYQRIIDRLTTRLNNFAEQAHRRAIYQRKIDRYQQRKNKIESHLEDLQKDISDQHYLISGYTETITKTQLLIEQLSSTTLQQTLTELQTQLTNIEQRIAGLNQNDEPIKTSTKNYLYANSQLIAIVDNEQLYYVHNDHLGTPQAITDQNQKIVWQAVYDPFGKATIITETLENNIRFPGQYFDKETGLHYNYYRYYDPTTGRYITSDPIGLKGGLNTYAYVENNPLIYIDPQGLRTLRCARKLGDRNNPAMSPSGNPLRHDYLVADDEVFSFQAGDNMLWSDGQVDRNENKSNEQCKEVSNDPKFDSAVKQAVSEIGAPKYNVYAYPFTTPHKLGARNCQTWVNDVLDKANRIYLGE